VAIVKANYTRSKAKVKASVRYIQHRPGRDGERLNRSLFGNNGQLTREEAYELIDKAPKGTRFYRMVISPDPKREDTDKDLNLAELTAQTLAQLSDKLHRSIQIVGAIHDDHRPHRHVHVIAFMQGRLTREHFKLLREQATELGQFQRLEADQARGIVRGKDEAGRILTTPAPSSSGYSATTNDVMGGVCPVCGGINCFVHEQGLGRG
jgi:hypothetical protein